jgi:type I restriction enzyme S subunit
LSSQSTVDAIMATCTGARMPRANLREVLNLNLPLPPLAEQRRVVAILDEAFDGIDIAISGATRNVVNANDLFQAARAALFSSRDSSWTSKPLAAICENLDGRRRPVTKRDRVPGDVPYYGASGIVDSVRGHLFDEDLLLVSEDGANLVARTYPIAFSITGRSWVNNHAHVLRFSDKRTQKFVEHYLNSINLEPYITGMAQPKLNQGALNKIFLHLPSAERQGEIVASLEQLDWDVRGLKKVYEGKLAALSELKQSLLARAFSGELTREPLAA